MKIDNWLSFRESDGQSQSKNRDGGAFSKSVRLKTKPHLLPVYVSTNDVTLIKAQIVSVTERSDNLINTVFFCNLVKTHRLT